MARLEELTRGARVRGLVPGREVTVIDATWHGSTTIDLTFKDDAGQVRSQLLFRTDEPRLEIAAAGSSWNFTADGASFKLAVEAERIRLAWLVDPMLAVNTSNIEPLPHQITAVYEEMLPRQPLRFLLADDPGAGKTIMTGLYLKELIARGDLRRCLIVSPGSLAEQWQDEMWTRFHLRFDIVSRASIEESVTSNPFLEKHLVIARLDQLSRSEEIQAKLDESEWDVVVCDEAHKMSATYFGNEAKFTKRYRLGQQLSHLTRHFLLLTATPHNGKEEDFQLFLALLDGDRFEGKFRQGVHVADTSDLWRRLTKEQLLKFDGTRLFRDRIANTVQYQLSDAEADLYSRVTEYVRTEFDRAEKLKADGRKGTVGFALTILQRRLASSPEAIYQSLRRRRERLESRLREEKLTHRGEEVREHWRGKWDELDDVDLEELDEAPDGEGEALEEEIVDQATAAQTIAELEAELVTLRGLEALALIVRRSNVDTKWSQMSAMLQDNAEMFDADGHRRKLVVFTEHRDTLEYLTAKIRAVLGKPEAVVAIHGSVLREQRKQVQEAFTQNKDVEVLVATDAAGEGINLQRAHLMVNYDLPWNPNRLEQRFGRIHRIGQTEICHVWNLVARETREGDVFVRLLEKLEEERRALGGAVFDVLGQVLQGSKLRELMIEAIRYGDRDDVRAKVTEVVRQLDHNRLREMLSKRALARDVLDASIVERIRAEMERAAAQKLQPHHVATFFFEAFKRLGGTSHEREPNRHEVTHVPATLRARDRAIGVGAALLPKYERVTFEKNQVFVAGKPMASLIAPGHSLLDATLFLTLEQLQGEMRRGAILVDPNDAGDEPRLLFLLEHTVQDGRRTGSGEPRVISRRLQFVEVDAAGSVRSAGMAPHLNYDPASAEEISACAPLLAESWLSGDVAASATSWAIGHLASEHLESCRSRKHEFLEHAHAAVKDRLTKEIQYWDRRAQELKAQEQAGKQLKMNWQKAQTRADELQARLERRLAELDEERTITATAPIVVGGALVIPRGRMDSLLGRPAPPPDRARETKRVELLAMEAVFAAERRLGHDPRDVSAAKCGYDIESKHGTTGGLRFIEVKGRVKGANDFCVTRNEIVTALNTPESFVLALVEVDGDRASDMRYVRGPFRREPDFGVTTVTYSWRDAWTRATAPS